MGWSSWNKADKTLLAAAVLFAFALCLHLEYRGNVWAKGLLFASEAALVGGIADWFAVTALFRRPLGFPYHTAILPRRRAAFIESSVVMVQQEFFSKRKLFGRLRAMQLMPMLFHQLEQKQTQDWLLGQLLHYAKGFILRMDRKEQAERIVRYLKLSLGHVSNEEIFLQSRRWLQTDGRDLRLLGRAAEHIGRKAAGPQLRKSIEELLEAYQAKQTQGIMASFFVGLAHAANIVNFEEAAELIQEQLLSILSELAEAGSPTQRQFLELVYRQLEEAEHDEAFMAFFMSLRNDFIEGLPLQEIVEGSLLRLRDSFLAEEKGNEVLSSIPMLRSRLREVLEIEFGYCLQLLKENPYLQREVDRLLYDLAARSALQAQSMVGTVVRSVLSRLTDEQMNRLVYDKVEPDMLWIRMNGSIVGFGIGICLFFILQII